jgi:hypothetical protein
MKKATVHSHYDLLYLISLNVPGHEKIISCPIFLNPYKFCDKYVLKRGYELYQMSKYDALFNIRLDAYFKSKSLLILLNGIHSSTFT